MPERNTRFHEDRTKNVENYKRSNIMSSGMYLYVSNSDIQQHIYNDASV